jgi:drug/metabolite transporter (DMT)-like permease
MASPRVPEGAAPSSRPADEHSAGLSERPRGIRQRRPLSHRSAVLAMVAITLMWSIAGVVTRHLDSAKSFEVTFWRSAFNAMALMVFMPLLTGPRNFVASVRSGGWQLLVSSLCWSVMYTAFMVAMTMTTVANVLVTLATGPLFTALTARFALGHRLAPRTLAAIIAAGAGIAWMYAREVGANDARSVQGMLIALAVPIAGAVNWTLVQHNQRSVKRDLVPAVLLGAVISSLATLPLSVPFMASNHDLGLLALLGVVQLAIPCSLVMIVARSLSAPEVALLALLEVLFGVLWAWLGAGEEPSVHVLMGGALVLCALVGNELIGLRTTPRTNPGGD